MLDGERSLAETNLDITRRFSVRLNKLLNDHGYPTFHRGLFSQLADRYNVSPQTAAKWCRGEALPSPGVLFAMASDFNMLLDELLGDFQKADQEKRHAISGLVQIPIYRLPPFSDDTDAGQFYVGDTITTSPLPFIPLPKTSELVCVVAWADSVDPPIKRGDVLMININCGGVSDEGAYILRKQGKTFVRRASVRLDGRVHFTRIDGGNQLEETVVSLTDLEPNLARDFKVQPSTSGTMVIGRIVSYYRRLEHRGSA